MKWYFILLIVLGSVILFVCLLFVLLAYALFLYVYKRRKGTTPTHELDSFLSRNDPITKQIRQVVMPSIDFFKNKEMKRYERIGLYNKKLFADYYPNNNSNKTIVFVHGYRSSGFCDFALQAKDFYEKGYNVFLLHMRSHDISEGKYITFGWLDKYDLLDWLKFVNENLKPQDIYIYGMSMGCGTLEMASSIGMPENVRALIFDCGYSSTYDEMVACCKPRHIPVHPTLDIMEIFCRMHHFSMKKAISYKALENNVIPSLFIHGRKDDFVPFAHGQVNYEHCSSYKEYYYPENAEHAQAYVLNPIECRDRIFDFIDRVDNNKIYE